MATATHLLGGITRTIDDAVYPAMLDAGRPVDDTKEAIIAAAHALGVKGCKGTATVQNVIDFAALFSVTVVAPG
jgi:hypothetical protein